MKKILALLLTVTAVGMLSAAPAFRIDVSGFNKSGRVKLAPAKVEGDSFTLGLATWLKGDMQKNQVLGSVKVSGSEWKSVKFSFKAENSGTVDLRFGGSWGKTNEEREWVLVSKPELNGEALPNSDFAKTDTNDKGVTVPTGYSFINKPEFLTGNGPDGANAVKVNHDHRLSYPVKVEEGKTYTVTVQVKAAE